MTVLGHRRRWLYRKPHGHALVDAGERVVEFMHIEPRPGLRFAIGFCLAVAVLLPLGFAHAHAEPTDDLLRLYAVNIGRPSQLRRLSGKRTGHYRCPRDRPQHLKLCQECASLAWSCLRTPSRKATSS